MTDILEKVARAIGIADLNASAKSMPDVPMELMARYVKEAADAGHYEAMARAAIEAMPPAELIAWRWKSPDGTRWQYNDGPEKPDLGHTPAFASRVVWEPVFGAADLNEWKKG